MATPVFDGAQEGAIKELLKMAGMPESGQFTLYDGRSGEAFDRPVTVGYMYMLKLSTWWTTRCTRVQPALQPGYPAAAGR